jgi:hypothetical protein
MSVWDMVRRTGQRQSRAFVLQQIPSSGADPGGLQPALVPEQDYFQVWLSQMFLGTRSTLTADWLPAAHARVSLVRTGRPPMEYSKVLRPEAHQLAQGVKLNYPLTPLIPFNGGMVEIEAALVAWQQSNRMDVAVELLQSVSALAFPLPAVAPLPETSWTSVTGGCTLTCISPTQREMVPAIARSRTLPCGQRTSRCCLPMRTRFRPERCEWWTASCAN